MEEDSVSLSLTRSTMRWLAMNRTALGESGVHVRNFSNTVQQKP